MTTRAVVTPISITEDEWIEQFKPLPDPENNGAGFDYGDGSCLVDYHGAAAIAAIEKAHVERRLWTVLDCDGEIIIASGCHRVNKLGFIITQASHGDKLYEILTD